MQKTKLGVSVGLVGAALYFLGVINLIPAFLLAAYVLLKEENSWLKKTSIKMMTIVIAFGILSMGVSIINYIVDVLNLMINWFTYTTIAIRIPLNLTSALSDCIFIVKNGLLILFGLRALKLDTLQSKHLDNIIDKHTSISNNKTCPNCNIPAEENALFCADCGHKFE